MSQSMRLMLVPRWPHFAVGLPVLLMSLLWLWPVWQQPARAHSVDPYWEMALTVGTGPWKFTNFGIGYPLLLALLQALGGTPLLAVLLQKGLTLLSSLGVAQLAQAQGASLRVAVGAGLLFGLSPMVQAHSSVLLTETLYLFWVVFGLRALQLGLTQLHEGEGGWRAWLLAGLLLGASSLTRGNGLLVLGLVLGGVGLQLGWQSGTLRTRGLLRLSGLAGVALLFPLVMAGLNQRWYGEFKPTSSGDYNLGVLMIGPVMCTVEGKPVKASASIWLSDAQVAAAPNGFVLAREVRAVALRWAPLHPVPLLVGTLKGAVNALVGPSRALIEELTGQKWLVLVSLGWRGMLALGVFWLSGLLLLRAQTRLLGVFVLGYVAVHVLPAGAGGYARFGLPVELLSSIGLALGLERGLLWFGQKRWQAGLARGLAGKDEA